MVSWYSLPADIRLLILETLLQDGCSLARFATVSREWQSIIERHTFAKINLTSSRLANFSLMTRRNQALVRYIWLRLELQEYNCDQCEPHDIEMMGLDNTDNTLITTAFLSLFSTLSTWESNSNLLLDISVYSPSDSEHWFKYLTFAPDISSDGDLGQCLEQSILDKLDDHQHGWVTGRQASAPSSDAIHKVFDEILGEGPFDSNEQENEWWQQLPLVPAVKGVLLRQQTRRRWKPTTLAQMLSRFPRLQEIYYEPWREWCETQQRWTDQCKCYVRSLFSTRYILIAILLTADNLLHLVFNIDFELLFESLASSQLRKLILFENFNQQYPLSFMPLLGCDPIRIPTPNVTQAVASISLRLEHLSASFIIDASYFFYNRKLSWEWPSLISLTLTSRLLSPYKSSVEIDNMLREAAAAAIKMPNLKIMEIWHGQDGLATLFRYQVTREGSAILTCRATWQFALRPPVVQAWEAVAQTRYSHGYTVIQEELLDNSTVIKSHGDAIHHLKLLSPVIRPISLRQIQMEHRIREGVHSW